MNLSPALHIQSLSASYTSRQGKKDPILTGVSATIGEEIVSVIGPSGGGKSTLIHCLSGIIEPTSGSITLNGLPLDPKRHQIALVPQQYGLLPWKRVRENILLPHSLGKRIVSDELQSSILHTLDIQSLLDRYPSELSGGQRQRVALARAFIMRPDLLLLDEAFSALDIATAERCRDLFAELWQRYPTPTLLVTHSPEEATKLTSRTLLIGQGTLLADLRHPTKDELTQHLLQIDEALQ